MVQLYCICQIKSITFLRYVKTILTKESIIKRKHESKRSIMREESLKEPSQHGTPDFPVALYNNHFNGQYDLLAPLHYHREFEFLVITKGIVNIQIEKESYTLQKGEGVFINSGFIHRISSADKTEHGFIALVFDYSLLCNESDKIFMSYIKHILNQSLLLPISLSKEICMQVEKLCSIFEQASFGYEFYIKSSLYHILFVLIQNARKVKTPVQNVKSNMIKTVIDYIKENYSKIISLQELADYIHISREYLCRMFHEITSVSPVVYLNQYRVQQSTLLLLDKNKNISDIAFSCGFHNSSYFNKLFKRYMGCTPTEFREKSTLFSDKK